MNLLFEKAEERQHDVVELWARLRSPEDQAYPDWHNAEILRVARQRASELIAEMAQELG